MIHRVTDSPYNKILTNIGCWTPDGRKLLYDVRSTKNGDVFDGTRIESVNVQSGETEILYESRHGACCGVVTCSPVDDRIVFIHGPENPDELWSYSFQHRRGTLRFADARVQTIDACNVEPPLQPGALRGGSHVHVFSGDGKLISFTYNDHILDELDRTLPPMPLLERDTDQRNVGVCVPLRAVSVNRNHPRNHDGAFFSVLVTTTTNRPRPGSDEICKAYEEAWLGRDGYICADGTRRKYALAFLGDLVTEIGQTVTEVFLVDLPETFDDFSVPGSFPLEGTMTRRPRPPKGVVQRRLTRTTHRKYPGVQGPRHWVRTSPDGSKIAFLMKDDDGIVQAWTVSPHVGKPQQWTRNKHDIGSAFSWSPDGHWLAYVMDNSIFATSETQTLQVPGTEFPLPHAVVFSPDSRLIAYMKNVPHSNGERYNQIFVAQTPDM